VRILVTVDGNIYRGDMSEFVENGITDEVVFGFLEMVLDPYISGIYTSSVRGPIPKSHNSAGE
jgi:hypothetical protein